MSYDVTVKWGMPQSEQGPTNYSFHTRAERDAFLRGIEEHDGWMEAEVTVDDQSEDSYMLHVIAVGNAFDGVSLRGPFVSVEDAIEYGETLRGGYTDWSIVEINKPD